MRLNWLMVALLPFFIIVATDDGLFDGNKHLSKEQIQRDQQNNPESQAEGTSSGRYAPPEYDAYPPLPN